MEFGGEEIRPQVQPLVDKWTIKMLGGELGSKKMHLKRPEGTVERHFIKAKGGLVGVEDAPEWQGILKHALVTFRVVDFLGNEFEKAGVEIDGQAAREAAISHDTGRRSFDEGTWAKEIPGHRKSLAGRKGHGWLAAVFLRREARKAKVNEEHYEKVARIVEAHDQTIPNPPALDTIEKKLVFYADQRALITTDSETGQPRLMSLDERLAGIKKRWVDTGRMSRKQWEHYESTARKVEKEIFDSLGGKVKPEDLPGKPTQAERDLVRVIEAHYGQKISL